MSDEIGQPLERVQDLVMEVPALESVRHWMRPLEHTESFTVVRMTRRKGNISEEVFSFRDLARAVARGVRDFQTPLSSQDFLNAGFNWVNSDNLVAWIRTVVGDVALAEVLESRLDGLETEYAKMRANEAVLDYRFRQYADVLEEAGELPLSPEDDSAK